MAEAALARDLASRLLARDRSAVAPAPFVEQRARSILDGAGTIERDGRAACFEG